MTIRGLVKPKRPVSPVENGGEVVVQHEAVAVFAHDRVNDLLVLLGAERGNDQRLRFTAGEQGTAVRTRQNAQADVDGTYRAGVPTVDAGLAIQNLLTDDFTLQRKQDVVNQYGIRRFFAVGFGLLHQRRFGAFDHFGDFLRARLLGTDLVSLAQAIGGVLTYGVFERFVAGRRLPVPLGFAGLGDQLVDGVDDDLHLLVAKHDATQHDFFVQLLRFGFDHQHS